MSYTLKQVAEMGWLSPKEAKQLRAKLAKAEEDIARLRRRNSNQVHTEDMLNELERLGFVEMGGSTGRLKLLHHPVHGLTLTVPTISEVLPPVYVSAIETQLENFGVKRKADW